MFSKAEVVQLFPTCIWVHQVEGFGALNDRLSEALLHLESETPVQTDPPSAWQSADDLHQLPPFQGFAQIALTAARGALDYLKCRYDGLYITSCCANVNGKGHSHHDHTHPNNYLSGVYYVRVPSDSGAIVFSDPRPQAHVLAPTVIQRSPFNANIHPYQPQEGTMLLFPSWLPHMVEANLSEERRISIAFNVMLKGKMGAHTMRAEV